MVRGASERTNGGHEERTAAMETYRSGAEEECSVHRRSAAPHLRTRPSDTPVNGPPSPPSTSLSSANTRLSGQQLGVAVADLQHPEVAARVQRRQQERRRRQQRGQRHLPADAHRRSREEEEGSSGVKLELCGAGRWLRRADWSLLGELPVRAAVLDQLNERAAVPASEWRVRCPPRSSGGV